MFSLIIGALLPVSIILILGFFAGWHRDFTKDQANGFNQMVMLYALPMCLFCNIIALPIKEVVAQKELAIGLFIGCVVMYWLVFAGTRYLFKTDKAIAALTAIAVTCPSAAFMGLPILGTFFGQISSLAVSITSLFMNLFLTPFTILFLLPNGGSNTQSRREAINRNLLHVFKQPIVIAPLVALVIAFMHLQFPAPLISAFDMLGKTTAGLAIFACGLMLYSYKVKITKAIWLMVVFRNLIIPALMWGIVHLLGFPLNIVRETILTLAIPSATMALILAIQYNRGQQLMTSELFLSTALSFVTMALFISFLY